MDAKIIQCNWFSSQLYCTLQFHSVRLFINKFSRTKPLFTMWRRFLQFSPNKHYIHNKKIQTGALGLA